MLITNTFLLLFNCVITIYFSASVRDADVLVEKNRQHNLSPHTTSTMEHRTLKQRENVLTGRRSPTNLSAREQHMRSLHELVQSIEGFQTDKSRNSTINLNSTRGVFSQDCGGSDLELPPPARILPFSGIKPQVSFCLSLHTFCTLVC